MKRGSFIAVLLTALVATVHHPALLSADSCQQKAEISSGADVYASLPKFVTGLGWQGSRQSYLPRGTQVYICSDQRIEFGLSTKVWSRIAYRDKDRFQFGWVMRENVTEWHAWEHENGGASGYSLVAVAYADETALPQKQHREWNLDKPPVDTSSADRESESPATDGYAASTPLNDFVSLYAPLFIAMLLGMSAKAAVDWLDASDNAVLRQHLRNAFTAFLVSPIVFLGFLNAGQFSTSRQTFIVLCLLAFQNGFFWQTVLKKDAPHPEVKVVPVVAASAAR